MQRELAAITDLAAVDVITQAQLSGIPRRGER